MTRKKLVFLGVLGLADCTPGREPRSVAASLVSNYGSTTAFQFHVSNFDNRILY